MKREARVSQETEAGTERFHALTSTQAFRQEGRRRCRQFIKIVTKAQIAHRALHAKGQTCGVTLTSVPVTITALVPAAIQLTLQAVFHSRTKCWKVWRKSGTRWRSRGGRHSLGNGRDKHPMSSCRLFCRVLLCCHCHYPFTLVAPRLC